MWEQHALWNLFVDSSWILSSEFKKNCLLINFTMSHSFIQTKSLSFMILLVFSSKHCLSFFARELFGKIKYASPTWQNKMFEIQIKWIIFVHFRTEKDHHEDTKKRQEHSDITSPWKGKYRQLYWPTYQILRHYWSDMTHLCLANTALIFDICYNSIGFTCLEFEWFV